ncbi:hypothetical protein PAMP_003172 [Pampus punctatissimus]
MDDGRKNDFLLSSLCLGGIWQNKTAALRGSPWASTTHSHTHGSSKRPCLRPEGPSGSHRELRGIRRVRRGGRGRRASFCNSGSPLEVDRQGQIEAYIHSHAQHMYSTRGNPL